MIWFLTIIIVCAILSEDRGRGRGRGYTTDAPPPKELHPPSGGSNVYKEK